MYVVTPVELRTCWLLFVYIQSFEVLEEEMLNGQKLQGPLTAKEVHDILLKEKRMDE